MWFSVRNAILSFFFASCRRPLSSTPAPGSWPCTSLLHSHMAHTSLNRDGCTHLYNGVASSPSSSLGSWLGGLLLMLHSPQPSCLEDCRFPLNIPGGWNESLEQISPPGGLLYPSSSRSLTTTSPPPSPQGFVFWGMPIFKIREVFK